MIKKIILSLISQLIFFENAFSQTENEMADVMRSNGKIYVVIGVIVILFVVLFSFIIYLDSKLTKKEKENQ